jgi:argininosuccinate lyase
MPHKRNPDLFELVRGQAALRQGELVALMATFQGLGTGYHRDLQQDKQVIFASVDGTIACLKMITLGLEHLDLVADRCVQALEQGDAIATDLTEHLVSLGVPFRVAYRQIGALVAMQRGRGARLMGLTAADLEAAKLPLSLLEQLDVRASAKKRAARY